MTIQLHKIFFEFSRYFHFTKRNYGDSKGKFFMTREKSTAKTIINFNK